MKGASELRQNFIRPDEMNIVRKMTDWVERVVSVHQWYLTDFLSPRELFILNLIVSQHSCVCSAYGGYENAERQRGLLMPENWYPALEDYNLYCLEICSFTKLTHGSILGAIIALGIDRKVFGDIVFTERGQYVLVASIIANFIAMTLQQVGNIPVQTKIIPVLPHVEMMKSEYIEDTISVPSLRIDAILAQSCGWSRSVAQAHIEKGLVTLNFMPLVNVDSQLFSGDLLSVRHFGRVKLIKILGPTKKNRIRLVVGILKSN